MSDAPKKRGRPPLGEDVERLHIRATKEDLALYDAAADRAGMKRSEWVRQVLLRAARRSR